MGYLEALGTIDEHLKYWPDHMINRCKQRLTKLKQMLIRMRKQSMKEGGVRMVPIKKKTERREKTRELKAEAAAKVDLAIEKELLERLKQGTYGDIYNFPQKQFDSVVNKNKEEEEEVEDESDLDFVEDLDEDELDGELEEEDMVERAETLEELGGSKVRDMEELDALAFRSKKRRRNVPRVELE